jgi:DNA-binding transcriptional LysR family regulator
MSDFANQLDWNLLHTFLVVVQEKSMTRASKRLFRTQPAVSQAIARLEQTTGVRLLNRSKSGLSPTPAGERLLEQVQSVFTTISRMPVAFENVPEALTGKIRIATIDSVVSAELDTALSEFFSLHPSVDLEISVTTTAAIIQAVELGTCTCGISDGVIPDSLRSREFVRESFALFCGMSHPLAGRRDVTDADLRYQPFVGFTADVLGGAHMGDVTAFRAKASIGQRVRGLSSYVNEVRRMIECGLGIGFLPVHLAEAQLKEGKLWRLPPFDDVPQAPIFLLSNPSIRLTRAEEMFLKGLFG